MKYLVPETGVMVKAGVFDSPALIIASAILVVVGIVVVTLSVLYRRRAQAESPRAGMSTGRLVFKLILLAAVAISLAGFFLLDEGELQEIATFLSGEQCCQQAEPHECCPAETAQACCPVAVVEETTQSQSTSALSGVTESPDGLAGEAGER